MTNSIIVRRNATPSRMGASDTPTTASITPKIPHGIGNAFVDPKKLYH